MKKSARVSKIVAMTASLLVVQAVRSEISFDYYPGEQHNLPDFSTLKADKSGTLPGFDPAIDGKAADENYSLRFQGGLKIEKDGAYTFYTSSDDGSKLWIDDRLVVNNDGDHSDIEVSGKIKLAAGTHKIVLGFFQAGGDRALKVSYEGAGIAKTELPKEALSAKAPETIPAAPTNIAGNTSYEYFEGDWDKLPDFSTLTPAAKGESLGFDIGLDDKTKDENFGVRFTAQIKIGKEGDYTFCTNSDDGSKLLIDDKTVVDNDGDHAAEEKEGKVTLTAGSHKIVVLYYQHGGDKSLAIQFAAPGSEKHDIPDALLSVK